MSGTTNNPTSPDAAPPHWPGHDPLHPGIVLENASQHVPAEAARHVVVGLANLKVSDDHDVILCTEKLGSCVCVAFYDPIVEVAGMLHVMLPQSSISPSMAASRPAMFLDTGIPLLLEKACELDADKHRMLVYLIGGAHIIDESTLFNIGRNNYRTATELLQQHGLRLRAQDVGGTNNRSVSISIATGLVTVKISGQNKEYRL